MYSFMPAQVARSLKMFSTISASKGPLLELIVGKIAKGNLLKMCLFVLVQILVCFETFSTFFTNMLLLFMKSPMFDQIARLGEIFLANNANKRFLSGMESLVCKQMA